MIAENNGKTINKGNDKVLDNLHKLFLVLGRHILVNGKLFDGRNDDMCLSDEKPCFFTCGTLDLHKRKCRILSIASPRQQVVFVTTNHPLHADVLVHVAHGGRLSVKVSRP